MRKLIHSNIHMHARNHIMPVISFSVKWHVVVGRAACLAVNATRQAQKSPIIGEFKARTNSSVPLEPRELLDEGGDSPVWIEPHTPEEGLVDWSNWSLTDDMHFLSRWSFTADTVVAS